MTTRSRKVWIDLTNSPHVLFFRPLLRRLRGGGGRGPAGAATQPPTPRAGGARLLRLHSTVLHDYEGAAGMHRINFRLADKVMLPDIIPFESLASLGLDRRRYRPYHGLKEQVALSD